MRKGEKAQNTQELITKFKTKSIESGEGFWKAVAKNLEKPNSRQRKVNVSRINRYTKRGETIVVPGKVLASGKIEHPVNVFALKYSEEAEKKIKEAKGTAKDMNALLKEKDVKKVRIVG